MRKSMRFLRCESGSGIVEMIFATFLATIVLSGLVGMLIQQHRFYLVTNDASEVAGVLHRMETAITPDFFPLSPGANDIVFAGADSVAMRAFRGVYGVCDKRLNVDVLLTLHSLTGTAPPADSAFVYSTGTRATPVDDYWVPVKIKSVGAAVCPDGTRAWSAVVPALNGILPQIPMGAPVRVYQKGSYWLSNENGVWTLRASAGAADRVIGGSLAPNDSAATSIFQFRYYDADGNVTADVTQIARIEIEATALGRVPIQAGDDRIARQRLLSIGLRNAGM